MKKILGKIRDVKVPPLFYEPINIAAFALEVGACAMGSFSYLLRTLLESRKDSGNGLEEVVQIPDSEEDPGFVLHCPAGLAPEIMRNLELVRQQELISETHPHLRIFTRGELVDKLDKHKHYSNNSGGYNMNDRTPKRFEAYEKDLDQHGNRFSEN